MDNNRVITSAMRSLRNPTVRSVLVLSVACAVFSFSWAAAPIFRGATVIGGISASEVRQASVAPQSVLTLQSSAVKGVVRSSIRQSAAEYARNAKPASVSLNYAVLALDGSQYGEVSGVTFFGDLSGKAVTVGDGSDLLVKGKHTVLAVGGDIYVRSNTYYQAGDKSSALGLVAIADASGKGGNVYIHEDVTNVVGAIYADRAVRSVWGALDASKIVDMANVGTGGTSLPHLNNQLLVYGTIISENTYGGGLQNGAVSTAQPKCPYYFSGTCDWAAARGFDLNFLRRYQLTLAGTVLVPANAGKVIGGGTCATATCTGFDTNLKSLFSTTGDALAPFAQVYARDSRLSIDPPPLFSARVRDDASSAPLAGASSGCQWSGGCLGSEQLVSCGVAPSGTTAVSGKDKFTQTYQQITATSTPVWLPVAHAWTDESLATPDTECVLKCASGTWNGSACVETRVNGVCGTANGKAYPSNAVGYGSDTQCATSGTASDTTFPSPGTSKDWTCPSPNGGNPSPMCTASHALDGVCGSAQRHYSYLENSFSDPFCSTAVPHSPESFDFPGVGVTVRWTCNGIYNGVTADCSATHDDTTYSWVQGGFGACSSACGIPGTQIQTVWCKNDATNLQATLEASCSLPNKPLASQSCNEPCVNGCASPTPSGAGVTLTSTGAPLAPSVAWQSTGPLAACYASCASGYLFNSGAASCDPLPKCGAYFANHETGSLSQTDAGLCDEGTVAGFIDKGVQAASNGASSPASVSNPSGRWSWSCGNNAGGGLPRNVNCQAFEPPACGIWNGLVLIDAHPSIVPQEIWSSGLSYMWGACSGGYSIPSSVAFNFAGGYYEKAYQCKSLVSAPVDCKLYAYVKCGTAQGSTFALSPTANLCTKRSAVGSDHTNTDAPTLASAVTNAGTKWTWGCKTPSNTTISCFALKPLANCAPSTQINPFNLTHTYNVSAFDHLTTVTPTAVVTLAHGTASFSATFTCNNGAVNFSSESYVSSSCDYGYYWNGSDCAVEAACGSANGTPTTSVPNVSNTLCTTGFPTARTGTGPWNWTCTSVINSGFKVNCSAPVAPRTQSCSGLPQFGIENSVTEITQVSSGGVWIPSNIYSYNTRSSTTECRFKCPTGRTHKSSTNECVLSPNVLTCGGTLPTDINQPVMVDGTWRKSFVYYDTRIGDGGTFLATWKDTLDKYVPTNDNATYGATDSTSIFCDFKCRNAQGYYIKPDGKNLSCVKPPSCGTTSTAQAQWYPAGFSGDKPNFSSSSWQTTNPNASCYVICLGNTKLTNRNNGWYCDPK